MIRLFWMLWVLAGRLRRPKKRTPLTLLYPVAPENPFAPNVEELEPQGPPIAFSYDPDPAPVHPLLREPGVNQGYVVFHQGPGPAKLAPATIIVGEDGEFTLTNRDGGSDLEFTDVTVVDDTDRIDP